ncbi:AfsR/SARP family transcriptional regulator [Streptomyces yaizuensis]|uniref:Tetratricopeptide repeat protein n=1 Tax=Streptomyces yaizuensis TaxID=2989713 RepID=A0ABQ5P3Q0_9ACTN|nr:BTAD domain-containing putative transcriptional regulator [Streptomyces sp. YSPA8]GLF97073.1 tetratricopeptide repeat protein [Streptomyces sp. YSPA8]
MEILLLGPVGLRSGGAGDGSGGAGARLELGSDKERTLLAALALEPGRPVSVDTLVDRLWDDDPPPQARGNLHVYVSRLRRRLRAAGDLPDGPVPRIVTRAHTYALETDPGCVDWCRFQRLTDTPQDGGDDERTAERLAHAELMWRGEALAGLPGLWAESVRRTLAERRIAVAAARIGARLRLGHFADVVGELTALSDRRPGDEALLGQLMLAYYGSGRYTEALLVHQRARQLLRHEFGAVPGPELNRIHRGVLDRVPARELARGGTPVSPAGGRAAQEPSAPAGALARQGQLPPRNLPHQPRLVGRRAELGRLLGGVAGRDGGAGTEDDATTDTGADTGGGSGGGSGAVITLEAVTGMAGVGKTSLAVHIAEQLAAYYPDGQLYLDLRAHSPAQEPLTPAAALATLLRLIGADAQQIPAELEERSALWRTMLAGRRIVVVLDDVAGADQVRPLLAGGSSALTIITSRRHLSGLPHALSIPLDVLPEEDAVALFRSFAGAERTGDITGITRIVHLCDCLPLAIELVANRFRARTSWTLATLEDRLTRTSGRLAEIRDAHLNLSGPFQLSYRTLTGPQRMAFRRLALHPGDDITADAAAALLGLPLADTERLLEDLCTCHLLQEPAPERYRNHDLVSEFAFALAELEDPEELRAQALRRLIDFWLHMADQADRIAYPRRLRLGPAKDTDPPARWKSPEAAKEWFSTERGNLLAVARAARTADHPESAARLAYAISGFLEAECHWQDAEEVLRYAVDHWTTTGDRPALCRALIQSTTVQARTSHYPEAAAYGERALDTARATGDTEAEAEALRTLGELRCMIGENRAALVLLQKAFGIKAVHGDTWDKARGYNNIAIALLQLGEHERAMDHFSKALTGFQESADNLSMAKTCNNIGDLFTIMGNLDSAHRSYRKALAIFESSGSRLDQAITRNNISGLLIASGDPLAALPLCLAALEEFTSLGDRLGVVESRLSAGEACRALGREGHAIAHLREAAAVAGAIGATPYRIRALLLRGQAEYAEGQAEAACRSLESARATAERAGRADEEAESRRILAEIHRSLAAKNTAHEGQGRSADA